jgi:hypothetical protein
MKITPQQKKYALIGLGIFAAGVITFYAFKKPATDNGGTQYDPTGNGGNPTGGTGYIFSAINVADTLHNAMKDTGTDEDIIFNALAPLSQAQFVSVIQKFGSRLYNDTLGNSVWGSPQNLKYWLEAELSTSDYETLRKKFPNNL